MAEIELRVGEIPSTRQDDVGRGIVRLDAKVMQKLGVAPGGTVKIAGSRSTVAIVDTAYPADVGLGIVRMDGLMRRNAGTSIGETVKIEPVEAAEAKHVTIAPAQKGMLIQASPQALNQLLLGRVFMKGDVIQAKSIARRSRAWQSPFEELFSDFDRGMGIFGMGEMKFVVVSTNPLAPVRVTEMTEVELKPEAVEIAEERIPEVTYEDIGGLREEVRRVREMIELPLKHPELFERLGIEPPKGVLLYGPPGTGKTLLAKAVANETNAHFILINGPEVMSKYVGEAEKRIREVFDEASKNAPSIIFLDEIDALAPKREESFGVEGRVVAQLLASLDGMQKRGQVIVIGATNRENSLDPALRRPGRLDREIEIGVPDREGRKEVLQIHTRNMPLTDFEPDKLADVTHGFVGADLEGLCKEAAMNALRRLLPELQIEEEGRIPAEALEKLEVTMDDFREALKLVEPSAMREVLVEIPKVNWENIGGLEDAKQNLREAVEWPLKFKDSFKRLGIKPPRGILLYGPPGTGKTMLAKAVANESEANFISIKGPELLSKWVGESEKAVRQVFRRARQVAPCIIFFDELDSVAPFRGTEVGTKVGERVVNQLLTELDGLEELREVVVIAASNRPDMVDPGLLRAGRIDRHIFIPEPDRKAREAIFQVHMASMPLTDDVDISTLADRTKNFTGADIESVCREAAILALREDMEAEVVTMAHFEKAIEKVGPSMNESLRKFYSNVDDTMKTRLVKKEEGDEEPSYMR